MEAEVALPVENRGILAGPWALFLKRGEFLPGPGAFLPGQGLIAGSIGVGP
jgi:hypothetical protein